MKKGPYEVTESTHIYGNPWITVREDKVIRPDGTNGVFGVVDYAQGAHIMALDTLGNAILIKEYMYAIERDDIMFPTGGVDNGEHPLEAAKRELLEEVGYESDEWVELGGLNPLSMVIKCTSFLFLAKNCRKVSQGEDTIEPLTKSIQEVEQMIEDGTISLAGSVCAFFKAKKHL